MASATLGEPLDRGAISGGRGGRVIWAWSSLAIATAYLPALGLLYVKLWSDPNYNFFPMVWLGAGLLAWRDTRTLGELRPGRRGRSWSLLGLCWLMLAASVVCFSPWMAWVGAQLAALVMAYLWGGGRLVRAVLPAWVLLGFTIPRLDLDAHFLLALQGLASRLSSVVLDQVGVFHLPQGNVIALANRRLLVESACSGIHSMFVILAAVVFFSFWARASVPRALVLLVATVSWVVVVNTGRIVLVTWALARVGLDLLGGWRHELLGLAAVLAALGLLASTDRTYAMVQGMMSRLGSAFLEPWRAWRERRALERAIAWQERRSIAQAIQRPLAAPAGPEVPPRPSPPAPPMPTRWPRPEATLLARPALAVGYSGISALFLFAFWPSIRVAAGATAPETELGVRLRGLTADALPGSSGRFRRVGFEVERREAESQFGEHSRAWRYQFGPREATASVDFPFLGWHELTVCYAMGGWTLLHRSEDASTVVEADLTRPSGDHATLFFSILDARGAPLRPGLTRRLHELLAVGRELSPSRYWKYLEARRQSYQVQLLVTGGRPLSAEEREQARAFFLEVLGRAANRGAGHAGPDGR